MRQAALSVARRTAAAAAPPGYRAERAAVGLGGTARNEGSEMGPDDDVTDDSPEIEVPDWFDDVQDFTEEWLDDDSDD